MGRTKKIKEPGKIQVWMLKIRNLSLFLVILLFLGFALYDLVDYAIRSELFMVREVRIEGNYLLTKTELLQKLDVPSQVYLWQIKREHLEARLQSLGLVQSVQVRGVLPQTLVVEIGERQPLVDWMDPRSGKHFVLDEEACILGEAEEIRSRQENAGSLILSGTRPQLVGISGYGYQPGDRLDQDGIPEVLRAVGVATVRRDPWIGHLKIVKTTGDSRGWILQLGDFLPEVRLGNRNLVERIGMIRPVWSILTREGIRVSYVDLRFEEQGIVIRPTNVDPVTWMKIAMKYPQPTRGKSGSV